MDDKALLLAKTGVKQQSSSTSRALTFFSGRVTGTRIHASSQSAALLEIESRLSKLLIAQSGIRKKIQKLCSKKYVPRSRDDVISDEEQRILDDFLASESVLSLESGHLSSEINELDAEESALLAELEFDPGSTDLSCG